MSLALEFSKGSRARNTSQAQDQFFDESQLESYRRLGYFAGCAAKDDFPPPKHYSEETDMENSTEKGHGDIGNQAKSFTQLLPPGEKFDITKLAALAEQMALLSHDTIDDGPDAEENLFVPAGYTYLGQFIDHDLTLDVTSSLNPEDESNGKSREPTNLRTPRFDLDCVYGTGPLDQPYMYASDGATLLLNTKPLYPPSKLDAGYDLARSSDGRAIIGDKRNDENSIVNQIQHAFILFHNLVVTKLAGSVSQSALFQEAQREVRWTYQRLLLDDFLPRIINKAVLDKLNTDVGKNTDKSDDGFVLYTSSKRTNLPREFVGAAYRYGHSGVRTGYRLNGRPGKDNGTALAIFVEDDADNTTMSLVGFDPLPPSHVIDDWARFFPLNEPIPGNRRARNNDMKKIDKDAGGEGKVRLQYAYKIDTTLVDPLVHLPPKIANSDDVPASVRHGRPSLALLNLLRGNAYELPSGQAIAEVLKVSSLPSSHLAIRKTEGDNFSFTPISTIDASFEKRTPLWFYVLAEAQSPLVEFAEKKDAATPTLTEADLLGMSGGDEPGPCAGTQLGPVGGRIVGEVFYGLLQSDSSSVWYAKNWKPMVGGGPVTMGKLLKFIGLPISDI